MFFFFKGSKKGGSTGSTAHRQRVGMDPRWPGGLGHLGIWGDDDLYISKALLSVGPLAVTAMPTWIAVDFFRGSLDSFASYLVAETVNL